MDSKTTFGFEKTRFFILDGILDQVIKAFNESSYCMTATRAAAATFVNTYRTLKTQERPRTKRLLREAAKLTPAGAHAA